MKKGVILTIAAALIIPLLAVSSAAVDYGSKTWAYAIYQDSKDIYQIQLSTSCILKDITLPRASDGKEDWAGFAAIWTLPRVVLIDGIYYTINFDAPISVTITHGANQATMDLRAAAMWSNSQDNLEIVEPGTGIYYGASTVQYVVFYDFAATSGGAYNIEYYGRHLPTVYRLLFAKQSFAASTINITLKAASAADIIGGAVESVVSGISGGVADAINPPMDPSVESQYNAAVSGIGEAASARSDIAAKMQEAGIKLSDGAKQLGQGVKAGIQRLIDGLDDFDGTFGEAIAYLLSDPMIMLLLSISVTAIVLFAILRKMGD